MQEQKILIIDYGSQYTQLIARRIRENKTYCEVVTPAYLNNPETYSAHLVNTNNPGGKYYTSSGSQ